MTVTVAVPKAGQKVQVSTSYKKLRPKVGQKVGAMCKLHKEIRDLRASIRERELCLETLGWAIGQVIPSFRATGTLTEHAAQTGAELVVTVNKLRACVYAADALAQEMNDLNEGADESVADYELAAYCEARVLVTR